MEAVAEDGLTFGLAALEARADKAVALRAIEGSVRARENVAEDLRADEDINEAALASERAALLAAVKLDGYALRSACKRLRSDREIILAAVRQNGKVPGAKKGGGQLRQAAGGMEGLPGGGVGGTESGDGRSVLGYGRDLLPPAPNAALSDPEAV